MTSETMLNEHIGLSFPYISVQEDTIDGIIVHNYQPQEDITIYELALLINLFGPRNPKLFNNWNFILHHNLQRHFT